MATDAFREIAMLIAHMRRLSTATVSKRLGAVGMSLPAYKVLSRLLHDREVLQHELAFDAALDPAAVSRLIRDMLDAGYVATRVDPADKRQRFVRLTPQGRDLERSLSPIVDAAFEPFSRILSPAEQKTLVTILRKAAEGVAKVAQEVQAAEAREDSQGDNGADTKVREAKTPRRSTKPAPKTSRP